MLSYSRDQNEGTYRSGEGGGAPPRYVNPDLSCSILGERARRRRVVREIKAMVLQYHILSYPPINFHSLIIPNLPGKYHAIIMHTITRARRVILCLADKTHVRRFVWRSMAACHADSHTVRWRFIRTYQKIKTTRHGTGGSLARVTPSRGEKKAQPKNMTPPTSHEIYIKKKVRHAAPAGDVACTTTTTTAQTGCTTNSQS